MNKHNINTHNKSPHMSPLFLILKPRSRKARSVLCLVLILLIQVFFISIHNRASQNFKQLPIINSSVELPEKESHYDHLIDIFQQRDFISKPFEAKSKLYFDSLYKFNPDWTIDTLANLRYYKKLAMEGDFNSYYQKECEREWQKLNINDKEERRKICSVVRSTILKNWKQNKHIENQIFNNIGHLKIFNQAYIKQQLPYPSQFEDLESRLFPMFTGKLPIFKDFNGDEYQNYLPNVDNEPHFESDLYDGKNLIRYMVKTYANRGLVFTCSDRHIDDLLKVIKVLRFLQNELPIQIIYKKGELSQKSQDLIISVARDGADDDETFKQRIWFVDVTPCIKAQYDNFFNGYSMKFLATIFSSFDEMIFIDNDAIPFIKPQEFFQLSNYHNPGAFFFKDRNFKNNGLNPQILNFLKKLLPSSQFDSKFFQIESIKDETISRNNFFKGLSKHFIDSGLFVLGKKTHIGGVLTSLHLSTWVPTSNFVYGDKELFWLGQSMVGNKISFSKHFASSAGELTNYQQNGDSNSNTHQICSSKLTHVSNDGDILWINGGLNYCNEKDINANDLKLSSYKGKFNDLQSLQSYYQQDFKIDSVIIPSLDLQEYPNSDNEPVKNWEFEPDLGCNNRFFCSFDHFGPLQLQRDSQLIQYDQDVINRYNDIIKTWFTAAVAAN